MKTAIYTGKVTLTLTWAGKEVSEFYKSLHCFLETLPNRDFVCAFIDAHTSVVLPKPVTEIEPDIAKEETIHIQPLKKRFAPGSSSVVGKFTLYKDYDCQITETDYGCREYHFVESSTVGHYEVMYMNSVELKSLNIYANVEYLYWPKVYSYMRGECYVGEVRYYYILEVSKENF